MAKLRNKAFSFLALIALGLVVSALSYSTLSRPLFSDTVTVWVFDIGQGDAILIDTGKEQVLVDGGPGAAVLEKLESTIPLWDRTIEYMINTHPHADHVDGLAHALERYSATRVFSDGQPYHSNAYEQFADLAQVTPLTAGTTIELARGARLEVLWPTASPLDTLEDPNDSSVTLLLTVGASTMLLTGDIGMEQEAAFQNEVGDIDILKVAHHGGNTSTGESFLSAVTPEHAIISLGKDNDYGHPSPAVINRLERAGAIIYRTDLLGDVRIQFTPQDYSIQTFRL